MKLRSGGIWLSSSSISASSICMAASASSKHFRATFKTLELPPSSREQSTAPASRSRVCVFVSRCRTAICVAECAAKPSLTESSSTSPMASQMADDLWTVDPFKTRVVPESPARVYRPDFLRLETVPSALRGGGGGVWSSVRRSAPTTLERRSVFTTLERHSNTQPRTAAMRRRPAAPRSAGLRTSGVGRESSVTSVLFFFG
mmetsp:Transcript_9022/g.29813  ORF Transcript_9022/g.29813 Transcript_9022/m.29813 type:complete len:202 (+) Transcript_9022:335-940(+)